MANANPTEEVRSGRPRPRRTRFRLRFVAVVMAAILFATAFALVLWPDPLEGFCNRAARDLPSVIPQRLLINVTDEGRQRLAGQTRSAVEMVLGEALGVYNFSNRLLPVFEDNVISAQPGDHLMDLRVYVAGSIPSAPLRQALGRMCGNIILLTPASDPAVTRLRLIHEFGHYFGLPHEGGTYMRPDYLQPDSAVDRFDSGQLAVLDVWNHPGTAYVPHWAR